MANVNFDFSKVASTYNGKHGCCCGCRGKHSYASAHRDWASKHRGYTIDDDEVSDVSVKNTFKKVVDAMNAMSPDDFAKRKAAGYVSDDFASFDSDTRTYVVYFKHD